MNYRHIYHAGLFADIFKHALLTLLIEALLKKDKAFCYIDTHAGIGLYDLQHSAAQKTLEYSTGLTPLLDAPKRPEMLQTYFKAIAASNGITTLTKMPRYYPGSPTIVAQLLRPQDRMLLNELHPEDARTLQYFFRRNRQVTVQQWDAYKLLNAVLPPQERRGLVFIDPAYEQPNEFTLIQKALCSALQRWATGIYAVWYPIKDKRLSDNFVRRIKTAISQEILRVELMIHPATIKTALNGCGLFIINPPWQLDSKLKELMPWLWQVLSPRGEGDYLIETL